MYRKVEVEGFYDDGYTQYWDDSLTSPERYRFVEWKARDGGIWRTERVGPGQVRKFQIDKPTARYHWRHPKFPSPYGHLMQRREDTIVDTETGEVIARSVMGYRYPAFIDSLWARFMGGEPSICGFGSVLSKTLVGIDLKVQEK